MEKINVLPLHFYRFQCPEILLEKIINKLPIVEFKKDVSNSSSGHFYDEELFTYFKTCLTEVKKDLSFTDIDLDISACWINKTQKLQNTHPHTHPNSILSGLLYFSDEASGHTVFQMPNVWLSVQQNNFLRLTDNQDQLFIKNSIKPEKGKLIIFPSTIVHQVNPHLGNQLRYTLSFNTFATGIFSRPNTHLVTDYLNISTNTTTDL